MRLVLRRLRQGEEDPELVLGVLLAAGLALAIVAAIKFVPAHLIPSCTFHNLTGIPCPTCGSGRCAYLILKGRFAAAWLTQPLFASLAALGLVYSAYSCVVVFGRLPRIRLEGIARGTWRWIVAATVALTLANWIYLIISGR